MAPLWGVTFGRERIAFAVRWRVRGLTKRGCSPAGRRGRRSGRWAHMRTSHSLRQRPRRLRCPVDKPEHGTCVCGCVKADGLSSGTRNSLSVRSACSLARRQPHTRPRHTRPRPPRSSGVITHMARTKTEKERGLGGSCGRGVACNRRDRRRPTAPGKKSERASPPPSPSSSSMRKRMPPLSRRKTKRVWGRRATRRNTKNATRTSRLRQRIQTKTKCTRQTDGQRHARFTAIPKVVTTTPCVERHKLTPKQRQNDKER